MVVKTKTQSKRQLQRLQTTLPRKRIENTKYMCLVKPSKKVTSISAFNTRLWRLAMTCEYENTDREIKTEIVQNCLPHKLRMKALQNPDLTLTQLLHDGKAMKMSKSQAENIEGKQEINKLSGKSNQINIKNSSKMQKQQGGLVDRMSNNSNSRDQNNARGENRKCRNCGKGYPYTGKKTSLPMKNYVVSVGSKTTMKL